MVGFHFGRRNTQMGPITLRWTPQYSLVSVVESIENVKEMTQLSTPPVRSKDVIFEFALLRRRLVQFIGRHAFRAECIQEADVIPEAFVHLCHFQAPAKGLWQR